MKKLLFLIFLALFLVTLSNNVNSADYQVNQTWTCKVTYNVTHYTNINSLDWYSNTSANLFTITVNPSTDWTTCKTPLSRSIALQDDNGNKIPFQFIDITANASGSMSFFRVAFREYNLTARQGRTVDMFVKESGTKEEEYLKFSNPFTEIINPSDDPNNKINISYMNAHQKTISFNWGNDGVINWIADLARPTVGIAYSGLSGIEGTTSTNCIFFPAEDSPCQQQRSASFTTYENGTVFYNLVSVLSASNYSFYIYNNKNNWTIVDMIFGDTAGICKAPNPNCLFVGARFQDYPDGSNVYFQGSVETNYTSAGWRDATPNLTYGTAKQLGAYYVGYMWMDSLVSNISGGIQDFEEGNRNGNFFYAEATTSSDDRYGASDNTGTKTIVREGSYGTRLIIAPSNGDPSSTEFRSIYTKEWDKFRYGINITKLNENVTSTNVNPTLIANYTIPSTLALNQNFNWYIEVNATEADQVIEYVNMTIIYPNGTIMLNNRNATSNFTSPNYNFSSPAFKADDGGNYVLNASIKDSASGLIYVYKKFNITDNIAPNVTFARPLNNTAIVGTSTIQFNFSRFDNTRINTCFYYLDMTGNNISISNCENFTLNLAVGNHNMTIFVNDSSGNYGRAYVNFSVATDTTVPAISLTAPSGTQTSTTVNTAQNISDETGISYCYYNVTRAGNVELSNTVISNCANNQTFVLRDGASLTQLSTLTLNIFANDTSGNQNSASINFKIDTSTPSGGIGGAGGGGSPIVTQVEGGELQCGNWKLYPLRLNNIFWIKGDRTREISIVNNGTTSLNFKLACDDTSSETTRDVCKFVEIDKNNFDVEPNLENPTIVKIRTIVPPDSSFGDQFFYRVTVQGTGCEDVGQVSFGNKITFISGIFLHLGDNFKIGDIDFPIGLVFFIVLMIVMGFAYVFRGAMGGFGFLVVFLIGFLLDFVLVGLL